MSISCEVTSALIDLALREDVGENLQTGDVTSAYFVPQDSISSAYIYAKQDGSSGRDGSRGRGVSPSESRA